MAMTRYEPEGLTRRQSREVEGIAREAAAAVYSEHIHTAAITHIYRTAVDEVTRAAEYGDRMTVRSNDLVKEAARDYQQEMLASVQRAVVRATDRIDRIIYKEY